VLSPTTTYWMTCVPTFACRRLGSLGCGGLVNSLTWTVFRNPQIWIPRSRWDFTLSREREGERCWRLVSISGYPTIPVTSQVRKIFHSLRSSEEAYLGNGLTWGMRCDNRKLWIHHVTPCCVRHVRAIAFTWLSYFCELMCIICLALQTTFSLSPWLSS